jgi:hypothetical protein
MLKEIRMQIENGMEMQIENGMEMQIENGRGFGREVACGPLLMLRYV